KASRFQVLPFDAVHSNAQLPLLRFVVKMAKSEEPMKTRCTLVPLIGTLAFYHFTIPAQSLTVLNNFPSSESALIPTGRPLLAGGTVYGVTGHGGSNDSGIVYSVNSDGKNFTVMHDFSSDTNGGAPEGGLLLSGDTLYGTTALGGT